MVGVAAPKVLAEQTEPSTALENATVIIPTLNASKFFHNQLPQLSRQGIRPDQVLVIDSSSNDDTLQMAKDFGAKTVVIDRAQFNHGGTRQAAADLAQGSEFLVFLTQDAIPSSPNALKNILTPFADEKVGLVYGRQLPRPEASAIERHARFFNYPEESETRSKLDRKRLGVKTVFCSNSFAAYRRSALADAGGFPLDSFFAEDQVVAGKMLLKDWHMSYAADATVFHSHDYSIVEEFRRYFDVGVFHARNSWLLKEFGVAEGQGFKFVLSEIKYILKSNPIELPSALLRTLTKYGAYKIGQQEARLSNGMKAKLSMQGSYWRNKDKSVDGALLSRSSTQIDEPSPGA